MKILLICHKMNLGGTEKSLLSLPEVLKDKHINKYHTFIIKKR